jgi:putative lipoprotein
MKPLITLCACCAALGWLSGCAKPQQASGPAITGSITYRTPVTLEPNSVLQLRLTDVSVNDGPALEIATATITTINALPFHYSLPYEAARIEAQHRYTVDARLLSAGRLRFSTDTAYEVLTQNHGTQRDLEVVAVGSNETGSAPTPAANVTVFQNELRAGSQVSLYKAGFQDGHIQWLEEDRSNGTPQPLHARYEFKGGLLLRYADGTPIEIVFDDRGRPLQLKKNQQLLTLSEHAEDINAVRNRASLLRSHALAASEARGHRQATGG